MKNTIRGLLFRLAIFIENMNNHHKKYVEEMTKDNVKSKEKLICISHG